MAGFSEAADATITRIVDMLRADSSLASRIDEIGEVTATECLPVWRVVEHDRELVRQTGDAAAAKRLEEFARSASANHRNLAASTAPDNGEAPATDAATDALIEESRRVHCDAAMIRGPDGRWFDVVASSDDTRWSQSALGAPLHGWYFHHPQVFVPEPEETLCVAGTECLLAGHGPDHGSKRVLFDSRAHHARELRSRLAEARKLAVKAVSNPAMTRGKHGRFLFAIDFSDKQWDVSDAEVVKELRWGAAEVEAKLRIMSYNQWQGVSNVSTHIYRAVNTTYASLQASGSAGEVRTAAEWILENNPNPNLRVSRDDFYFRTVTFPTPSSFSWAGLAQMPGYFVWLRDSYRGAAYAAIHERGHNFGLAHAGLGDAGYGNQNDNMGCCKKGHWQTQRKVALHWIPTSAVAEVHPLGPTAACPECSRGGPFFLWPHDTGDLPPALQHYPQLGAGSQPPRGDTFGNQSQPGGLALAVTVAEDPLAHPSGDYQRVEVWIDAKAEEAETGAGEIFATTGKLTSSTSQQSNLQPMRSRTGWQDTSMRRGDGFVVYGDRISNLASAVPVSGEAIVHGVATGRRPALLLEALTEHDAPQSGLFRSVAAANAAEAGANADVHALATTAVFSSEPQPVDVVTDFATDGPLTTRDAPLQDACYLGTGAPEGSGAASHTDAACSTPVRALRTSFLGPAGESASWGVGCPWAPPSSGNGPAVHGNKCDAAPLAAAVKMVITPQSASKAPAGSGAEALVQAVSSLQHLATANGTADAAMGGFAPRRRFGVRLFAQRSESLVVAACISSTDGTPVSDDGVFVAAYNGAFPPYAVLSAGSDPAADGGADAVSAGAAASLAAAESLGLSLTSTKSLLCKEAGAALALALVPVGDNAVEARLRALRALAALGRPGSEADRELEHSSHGLRGSSLPSLFLAAGAVRNTSSTLPWAQAPSSPHGHGSSRSKLRVTLSVFRPQAFGVDVVAFSGGYVLKGDWTLRKGALHNGRHTWAKSSFVLWWTGSTWRVSSTPGDNWWYENAAPDSSYEGTDILGLDGVSGLSASPKCTDGSEYKAGSPPGSPPHPVPGRCVLLPSGLAAGRVCSPGTQPNTQGDDTLQPCLPCPPGTYKSAASNATCTACPSGQSSTPSTGAQSSDACGKSADSILPLLVDNAMTEAEAVGGSSAHAAGGRAFGDVSVSSALPLVLPAKNDGSSPSAASSVLKEPSSQGWCRLLRVSGVSNRANANGVMQRVPGLVQDGRPVYYYDDPSTTSYDMWLHPSSGSAGAPWAILAADSPTDYTWWKVLVETMPTHKAATARFIQDLNPAHTPASEVSWQSRNWWDKSWSDPEVLSFDCVCADDDPFDGPNCMPLKDVTLRNGMSATHSPNCQKGFKDDGNSLCIDVDECALGVCGSELTCTNTEGSFFCNCPPGHAPASYARDICEPCPAGTYSKNGTCVSCGPGASSPPMSTSASACGCARGMYKAAANGACVAPDTTRLSHVGSTTSGGVGSADLLFVTAAAFTPDTRSALARGLGLPSSMSSGDPVGSLVLASNAAGQAGASLPLLWGGSSAAPPGAPSPPAGAAACLPQGDWWAGSATASLSGFTLAPATAGANALARQAGLVGEGDAGTRLATVSLVRKQQAGSRAMLPAGLGRLTDLDAFAFYGSNCSAAGSHHSLLLPPSPLEASQRSMRVVDPSDDTLRAAAGADSSLLSLVLPRVPMAPVARGASSIAAGLGPLAFARPASAARQFFGGSLLAIGAEPHDDGMRLAAALAPHDTAVAVAKGVPGWSPSSLVPLTLASGHTRLFNASTGLFEAVRKAKSSVGSEAAAMAESNSLATTVGARVSTAVASDAFRGPSCVVLAGPGGLAKAACGQGYYLSGGCMPALTGAVSGQGLLTTRSLADSQCSACTVCGGATPVTLAPCSALADTVCGPGPSAVDCSSASASCGASAACGLCAAGQTCSASSDCNWGLVCSTSSSVCVPQAAASVAGAKQSDGSVLGVPLSSGQVVAVPVEGLALRPGDFGPETHRRAVERALQWSISARLAGRASAVVQLLAAVPADSLTAGVAAVEAAMGAAPASAQPVDAGVRAESLLAAGGSTGLDRLVSAADALGIGAASSSSSDGTTTLLPRVDRLPTSVSASRVVVLFFRVLPIAGQGWRAAKPEGTTDLSGPERSAANTTAAVAATVSRAALAAATDVSARTSLVTLARGFLRRADPAEASLASRMYSVVGGSGEWWEESRGVTTREADEGVQAVLMTSQRQGCVAVEDGVRCAALGPTAPPTPTSTPSPTATPSASFGASSSPSSSPTNTPTSTPTTTPSPSPSTSVGASVSPTSSPTITPSSTPTSSTSQAASSTPSPSSTPTTSPSPSSTPTTSASPSATPSASPSPSPLPVDCLVSSPATSNCTKTCGDGGVQFVHRRVLQLPQHGGQPCPSSTDLVERLACPTSIAASLPVCPATDPCPPETTPCGLSSGCELCAEGRRCATSDDCGATVEGAPLVCRVRRPSATVTVCLPPLVNTSSGRPPLEDSLPPLLSFSNNDNDNSEKPNAREPLATDKADGVVVQVKLQFSSMSPFRSAAAVAAMRKALADLVRGLGLPPNATVRVSIEVEIQLAPSPSPAARVLEGVRLLQAEQSSAVASVAIDLDDASANTAASSASVGAAAALASQVTTDLATSTGTVAAAMQSALIEADPAAADVTIAIPEAPVYAVVAANDGAVIAGSASVMAAVLPSPSPSGTPSSEAIVDVGQPSGLPTWLWGAVGGGAAAVVLMGLATVCMRRRRRQVRIRTVGTSPSARSVPSRSAAK